VVKLLKPEIYVALFIVDKYVLDRAEMAYTLILLDDGVLFSKAEL